MEVIFLLDSELSSLFQNYENKQVWMTKLLSRLKLCRMGVGVENG